MNWESEYIIVLKNILTWLISRQVMIEKLLESVWRIGETESKKGNTLLVIIKDRHFNPTPILF